MKRNDITTVDQLKPGDRFCKPSEKGKIAYEFIGEESYGKYEVCNSILMKNGFPSNNKITKIMKGGTVVVFLRNVNDKT